MKRVIIACKTLQDELELAIRQSGCPYPVIWVDSSYHVVPDRLRSKLQSEIDALEDVDTVLFAYGSCGNGLVGLKATTANLIIPRTEDCISVVLSKSGEKPKRQNETYFITKGWLESSKGLYQEYLYSLQRYGKARTNMIFELMLKNYKYLMLIDTGAFKVEDYQNIAVDLAAKLNLELVKEQGGIWFLTKLLSGPHDGDFCVVSKGGVVTLDNFAIVGERLKFQG